ncbi:MAG: hypothetical protein PHC88_05620 [Terrimicrobiaceae bacterium]|nr:hypothetical protein [Terrimicrobiaceae bacterium]
MPGNDYSAAKPSNPHAPLRGLASSTDTADHTVIAAPGAGLALMITTLVIYNAHATTGTGVLLKSGTTTIWGPIPAPGGKGGCVIRMDPPLPCNANQVFAFACEDSVTTVTVSALGYRANG